MVLHYTFPKYWDSNLVLDVIVIIFVDYYEFCSVAKLSVLWCFIRGISKEIETLTGDQNARLYEGYYTVDP